MGTFSGCLKTRDYTPLEPNVEEHKYYCPKVGSVVLIEHLEDGELEDERVELLEVTQ